MLHGYRHLILACLIVCCAHTVLHAQTRPVDRTRLPTALTTLSDEEVARILRMSPRAPLATDATNRVADDLRAAQLGHRLFFDKRLSPGGFSCASCHEPARAFTDGRNLARGVATGTRNAPSLLDAARRRWNGWDGKFDSLWSQALAPIEHEAEMAGDRTTLVRVVRDDPDLAARYKELFGPLPSELMPGASDPLALPARPVANNAEHPHNIRWLALPAATQRAIATVTANLLKSIGAYERKLVSTPAPIDHFVAYLKNENPPPMGNIGGLDESAQRGLAIFVGRGGCYQCHRGAEFTDEEFHNLGFAGANGRVPDDAARLAAVEFLQANPWNCAGEFSDAPRAAKGEMVRGLKRSPELFGQFRTASLRGVAETPPYMHDGRFTTLEDVIRFYDTLDGAVAVGHHGEMVLEPLGLGESGQADLVAFLRSISASPLKSEWTEDPLAAPLRSEGEQGR